MTQDRALEILKSGKNVFLTGEPGTGKTYTINLFKEWLIEQGKRFQMTASTGIAATHINGVTIHSFLGVGQDLDFVPQLRLDAIYGSDWVRNRLLSTDVLIVDEVSMLSAGMIDNIHKVLSFVRQINEPFGGIQMIFVGDFFQLPPISNYINQDTGKTMPKPVKYAYESAEWNAAGLQICYLKEHHRQDDPEFLAILSAIRTNSVTPAMRERLKKCRDNPMQLTELRSRNAEVDKINNEEFAKLAGQTYTYEMQCEGDEDLLKHLIKDCLSPKELHLKVGAVVMFTRNNYPDQSDVPPEDRKVFEPIWVNGDIGKVVRFEEFGGREYPVVECKGIEHHVFIKEIWERNIRGKGNERVKAEVRQLPLRLAFAITIHKSQGMSLDSANIDLRSTFVMGQGYVALSRVRSLDKIHLMGFNDLSLRTEPKIVIQDKKFKEQSE